MSTMTIKKVKLVKEKTLEVGYDKNENGRDVHVTEKHPGLVHPDLRKSLNTLAIHFALITDLASIATVKTLKKVDPKITEDLTVTGYTIGGKADDEGVVITAQKKLTSGKVMTFNTPFTRFGESEEIQYKYIDQLIKDIEAADGEVQLYLDGKVAEDPQTEMKFTAGEEN